MKNFTYKDNPIIHKGRLYYLRAKYQKRGAFLVLTIRTHKNGKGRRLAQTKGIINTDKAKNDLLDKLNKKFKFELLTTTHPHELTI